MTADRSSSRRYTLLTGATGLIGCYLMADLTLSRLPVAVLVRSNRHQTAHDRIETILAELEDRLERTLVRPVILEGELTHPQLGLSTQQTQWIADHCERVLHSAASLSFKPAAEHPDNEPFRTNVDGTQHLLDLCTKADIREWHYVSTAYVCGLREGVVREEERAQGQSFANDYEQSKVAAEQMLHDSPDIDSLTVYRPSIVIDPAISSGMSDRTLYNTFATYRMLSQQFGIPEQGEWLRNLGLSGDERKNVVRADWVARSIVQILRHPKLSDRTYHLTTHRGLSITDLERGFQIAVEESGIINRAPSNGHTPDALHLLAAPFVATFANYFRDDPVFERTNIDHALAQCEESPCPEATVADILELSRDQIQARPVAASQLPVASVPSALQTIHDVADWTPLPNDDRSSQAVGLVASGPGGGEWTLTQQDATNATLSIGINQFVSTLFYARSDTWQQLLDGRLPTHTALEEGSLLIEADGSSPDASTAARLISLLQNHLARTRGLSATSELGGVVNAR